MEGAGVSPPTTEGINAPTPDRKKAKKILMATFGSLAHVFIRYLALLNENELKFGMEKQAQARSK
jgi:hypothetical protein